MKTKKTFLRTILALCLIIVTTSCGSSDDDCMRSIVVPQFYQVGNQIYTTQGTIDVPCDFPDPTAAQPIEPPFLADFSYEILFFEFTPDTGNDTRRLQFDIQLNNNSNAAITGQPISTVVADEITTTGSLFVNEATEPCLNIPANSSCIFSVDFEERLDVGIINSIEITNVQYLLNDN
ncbi:hypothetical protein [Nonlabens agnitus]|uniref:Uncharacterized protein n=1 Tax=Nonlabens agnitus TaxID=870484 RepID=A0A2S9WUD8_9FLAO|nr:hypothetical protein [Nonlabens agnitus]PRP66956.1 hypothetical protein BST86_07520 [Nonlabens agnitus]